MPNKFEHNLLPLRPYQRYPLQKRFENLDKNVLIQMPTGTGKGNIILHETIEHINQNKNVLIIVPNMYLVSNIGNRLKNQARKYYEAFYHGIYAGTSKVFNKGITVGVYKSMYNALMNGSINVDSYDVVIIDEAHRVRSQTYDKLMSINAIKTGYTATPNRLDGKPLGDVFNEIYKSPPLDWFIENQFLAPYKLFSVMDVQIKDSIKTYADQLELQQSILNNEIKIGELINHWKHKAYGLKTIIFVSGIDHGKEIKRRLNEEFQGKFYFEFIDKSTKNNDRDRIMAAFRSGKITGLINVSILTEGVDIEDCECVVLDRFTNSLVFYLQAVGRCLRYKKSKKAIILDLVGNALIHGSPSFEHDWDLNGKPLNNPFYMLNCTNCGLPLISKSKAVRYPDGITIECPNCLLENYFLVEVKKRIRNAKEPFIIDDGELIEFTANSESMKIHRILSSKKSYQYKLDKMLNLQNVNQELIRKGLRLLGLSEDKLRFYLD